MKKIFILSLITVILISISACGTKNYGNISDSASGEISETKGENSELSDASFKTIKKSNYILKIPTYLQNGEDGTWYFPNAENQYTNYITVTDVGHQTYMTEGSEPKEIPVPKDFEEISMIKRIRNENNEATDCEKVFFEYNDDGDYEEFTYIAKMTERDGGTYYDTQKILNNVNNIIADDEGTGEITELPDEIVTYHGGRTIVDKKDRRRVIVVTAVVEEQNLDDAEYIIRSFEWNK